MIIPYTGLQECFDLLTFIFPLYDGSQVCFFFYLLKRVAHVAIVQNASCYLSDLVTVPVVPLSDCYFQCSFSELTR